MAKSTNLTTVKKKPLKKQFDEYSDLFSFRLTPVPEAFIDRLATELLLWARDNEDALKLSQFLTLKGLCSDTYQNWCAKNENLKRAHKEALRMIGDRREIGAIKKKLDAGMVSYTMAHYDKDWHVLAEWRSQLAKKNDSSGGEITVVMQPIPSSGMIPSKNIEQKDES